MPNTPTPPACDPLCCPLCGKPNSCAMEREKTTGQPQGPCWCTQVDFTPGVLERIPTQARGMACLCIDCARTVV
jgi:hypothetical protein